MCTKLQNSPPLMQKSVDLFIFVFLASKDSWSLQSGDIPWSVQANGSPDGEEAGDVCPEIWRNGEQQRYPLFSQTLAFMTLYNIHTLIFTVSFRNLLSYTSIFYIEDKGDLLARCHYCTHYSSAIIVASFLVRMEPFSNTFQTLQVRRWTQHAPWPNWQTVQGISVFLLFLIIVFVSWTRQAFLSMLHWTCGV